MLVYPMLPVRAGLIRTLQKYRGNGNGKVDKLPVLLPFLQI